MYENKYASPFLKAFLNQVLCYFTENTCVQTNAILHKNILPLVLSINVSPFHKTVNEACTCPISASYEY